ncbi:UDP-3-O-(3-hydroxymyristoyl)glucosamine N-acyltransferase [Pigmentibacter ruber]|uniref:UDP-3-O-(3-hydroxymyristoyl)glucosamine N-acyltransferase n=1 Tax=Pigmentibacter ruber TaxID=2683196 RepID=UPI00131C11A1|nr:UDP-3-O-(3-hydroxymyristoyl)glucosamine N-acyltransferase [Pigmentibacter ruber]
MSFLSIEEIIEKTNCEINPLHKEQKFIGVAPLNLASPEHISFLINEKYFDEALTTKAGAIICSKKDAENLLNKTKSVLIVSSNPHATLAKISQHFFKPIHPFAGKSNQACIDETAEIHPTATIFPFAFIGPNAQIGENTVIYSGCFVGAASSIGKDCILYPNSVVREGCHLGDRCILNPGCVIGGDGFGFAPTEKENIKIPQIGGVQIADDVEIGANAAIDRGAMADTKIGRQTKIDNLVMIAHNVVVGEFCFIAAQTGIAGSTEVGNRVVMAGQVGVAGHLKIGDKATLTAQAGVSKNVPSGEIWGGSPARTYKEHATTIAFVNRLVKQASKK